jgi:hypothetical protein
MMPLERTGAFTLACAAVSLVVVLAIASLGATKPSALCGLFIRGLAPTTPECWPPS